MTDTAGFSYLVIAYGIAWAFLAGYVLYIFFRQNNLFKRLKVLGRNSREAYKD